MRSQRSRATRFQIKYVAELACNSLEKNLTPNVCTPIFHSSMSARVFDVLLTTEMFVVDFHIYCKINSTFTDRLGFFEIRYFNYNRITCLCDKEEILLEI